MSVNLKKLVSRGIHPHRSPELKLFEQRIARYLTREYQRLIDTPVSFDDCGVSTDAGAMWANTTALMKTHYDEPLELFKGFLDRRYMAYTMACYGHSPTLALNSVRTLVQAQQAKFKLICGRTGINGNERIFSIGCGFGALETWLIENYPDVEIVCITPSSVQADYVRERIKDRSDPLHHANLRLIAGDFGETDALGSDTGTFDIVFSIGTFEHVNNLRAAFGKIASLLKPGGKHFQHLITSNIVIPRFLDSRQTLTGEYYPGGRIWPFATIAAQSEFLVLKRSWFNNGINYYRTLDEWHCNFWNNIDSLYPEVLTLQGVKHWSNHFSLSKCCFTPLDGTVMGVGHFLFQKPGGH
ncbi:MAG: methyltransferase domain-containing protein [Gammaproteobacteria bacterium]|nr:methyltransferase domain-containing protein [Gammaproteobacteria bacterium]